MDWDEMVSHLAWVGALITVISFIIYMFYPATVFFVLFIVGVIILVGGYTVTGLRIRSLNRSIEDVEEALDERDEGGILSLDGPYIPENDDARIESLVGKYYSRFDDVADGAQDEVAVEAQGDAAEVPADDAAAEPEGEAVETSEEPVEITDAPAEVRDERRYSGFEIDEGNIQYDSKEPESVNTDKEAKE